MRVSHMLLRRVMSALLLNITFFLRWSSLQEMMWTEANGERKWWSESHVSEDFEMYTPQMKCEVTVGP